MTAATGEPSVAVRRLARTSGVVVSSGIAVAEVSAAFHRKLREEAVTPAVFKALQGQFAHDVDEGLWKLADPTSALLRDVQAAFSRLNRAVFVRSLDAIHLVTAKAEGFQHLLERPPPARRCPALRSRGCERDITLTSIL